MNQAKRQVVLDIETTGLSPVEGHRIVEIAAIELMDGAVTSCCFYHRINPEREIDEEVSSIIGMTWDTLKNEPRFAEVAAEFMEFIAGTELIMHHAPFDLGFLSTELRLAGLPELTNPIIDTLEMARELHPAQKNHLNALCERYHIEQTHPVWDGLLLDVKVIADVYLAMPAARNSFAGYEGIKSSDSIDEGECNLNQLKFSDCSSRNVRQVAVQVISIGVCPSDGGRVGEVAAIELLNGQDTGKYWHASLNPEVDPDRFHWPDKAIALSMPTFKEVASDFIGFLSDSELIFSFADSQMEFLNAELELMGLPRLTNPVLDLSELAKPLHPAASCLRRYLVKRYRISISEQEYPGVLRETKEVAEAFWAIQQRIQQISYQGHGFYSGQVHGVLDLAEAQRIVEDVPPSYDNGDLDLSAYIDGTPEALKFLAKQGYNGFVSIGFVELDKAAARVLTEWDAFLIFSNIRNLDVEVAAILSEGQNSLAFKSGSLGSISPELAKELAKMRFFLSLRLERLSLEAARELVKHPHELTLLLDTPPDKEILRTLCFHAGYRLHVNWKRPLGDAPCEMPSYNQNKKVFLLPHFNEQTERWLENVYIGDSNFYPDSLVDENGIITLL